MTTRNHKKFLSNANPMTTRKSQKNPFERESNDDTKITKRFLPNTNPMTTRKSQAKINRISSWDTNLLFPFHLKSTASLTQLGAVPPGRQARGSVCKTEWDQNPGRSFLKIEMVMQCNENENSLSSPRFTIQPNRHNNKNRDQIRHLLSQSIENTNETAIDKNLRYWNMEPQSTRISP